GRRKMVEYMIQNGANVKLRDDYQRTPLHKAVGSENHVMRLLANRGADVKAADIFGQTALHMAAEAGLAEDVYFLLGHGLAGDLKDNRGRTPRDLASKGGKKDVMRVFKRMEL
ncbi:ankyrin, partial [Aspergillus sclerotiicarbonarius CBS 121057]